MLLGLFLSACATHRDASAPPSSGARTGAMPLTSVFPADDAGTVKKSRPGLSRNVVRVANEADITPPEPAQIEKIASMVDKGRYLGLANGRLRFQPSNYNANTPVPALLEDAVIGNTVQSKLNGDGLEPGSFNIRSRSGVVQIRAADGSTSSSKFAKAINYALEVEGVVEVQVQLPAAPVTGNSTASSR